MSPWDFILLVMGWLFAATVFVGAAIFIFAVLVGGVRGIRALFGHRDQRGAHEFIAEATIAGMEIYKDEPFVAGEKLDAFKTGATWAWDQLR